PPAPAPAPAAVAQAQPPPAPSPPGAAPPAAAPPAAAPPVVTPAASPTARPEPAASAAPEIESLKLKRARVNGVQLAYVESGRGEPVVLVHGGMMDYRVWAPQIVGLSKRRHVVAYSRRYHFPNPPAPDSPEYSYAANEEDLVALIRALRLGKVHLVGQGYGAFVATLVARDHPELVRTLVLAEPAVYSMIPTKRDRRAVVDGLTAASAASGEAVRAGDLERAARQYFAMVAGGAA